MAKIDFAALKQRFKDYMFEKGERVALVVCGALAVLLVGVGIWNGLTSSRPEQGDTWQSVLDQRAKEVQGAITLAKLKDDDEARPANYLRSLDTNPSWKNVLPLFQGGPWIALIEGADTKRRNPEILAVLSGDKQMQIDVVRGGYTSYELDRKGQKVTQIKHDAKAQAKGAEKLRTVLKPLRMVVVSAVFPLREQLEEFRRALRLPTMQDLVANKDNLPTPLGLNIYRCEILPTGPTDWEYLVRFDLDKQTLEVAARIDTVMREAQLDSENNQYYQPYLHKGLDEPLINMPNIHYPRLKLDGIVGDFPDEPEQGPDSKPSVKMPGGKGPKDKGGTTEPAENVSYSQVGWAALNNPELQKKFAGDYDIFDPFARGSSKKEEKVAMEEASIGGGGLSVGVKGAKGGTTSGPNVGKKKERKVENPDALVRFFDVDVQPGKVYRYCVQVRMQNPNYNHPDVAYKALAEVKELYSAFTVTPEVAIPGEYHFYAVNQRPDADIPGGSDNYADKSDRVPVQVHKWVKEVSYQGNDTVIADWAIAERLLVRRGDFIGRNQVFVEVPTWSDGREAFELRAASRPGTKKGTDRRALGWPIDFQSSPAALLVDFAGGKQGKDEIATEVLVLLPDGKLQLRNSRIDTEAEYPEGKERLTRYNDWIERIHHLRSINTAPAKTGDGGKGGGA